MKKLFRQFHLWLSVPFGLIITVICFSGAMLVFESEIIKILHKEVYYVKNVQEKPMSVETLIDKVAQTLPDSVSVTGVTILSNPERSYQVNVSKPRRAALYIDQYTGEVLGQSTRPAFFMTMFRLHRWLLDTVKQDGSISWGKLVVGISTLCFVFALISGVVVWWPRTLKILGNSLKIRIKNGLRKFLYDLHIAGGMYVLVLLLVMALTGLTWSFGWYRTGFYAALGSKAPKANHTHATSAKKGDKTINETPFATWQSVYESILEQNPDFRQITISNGSASVSFDSYGNQRASDNYKFDSRSGELIESSLYQNAERSSKIRGWIYTLHVGSWGGVVSKVLTLLAALVGAGLPLTGYYLWIKRSMKRVKTRNNEVL